MIRILSGDLLIADAIVSLAGNPPLAALVARHGLKPGGKLTLNAAQAEAFAEATDGHVTALVPGGSSANMLATLSRLLEGEVEAHFLGVAGEGEAGEIIRRSLSDADVRLEEAGQGIAALSYVIMFPGGQCTIATYPGNARALMTTHTISPAMLEQSDAVLVQGSLWHKLDAGFPDALVALARRYGKKLWLTLPTQGAPTPQEKAQFHSALPYADLVLGNDGELHRLYGGQGEDELQALLANNGAIGFITRAEKGALLLDRKGIETVPPFPITHAIANTLGAGDTSYAGFVGGLIKGRMPHDCAQIAMALAAAKLALNAPRLPDPKRALQAIAPGLAALLG